MMVTARVPAPENVSCGERVPSPLKVPPVEALQSEKCVNGPPAPVIVHVAVAVADFPDAAFFVSAARAATPATFDVPAAPGAPV